MLWKVYIKLFAIKLIWLVKLYDKTNMIYKIISYAIKLIHLIKLYAIWPNMVGIKYILM